MVSREGGGVEPGSVDPMRLVMADDLTTIHDYADGIKCPKNTIHHIARRWRSDEFRPPRQLAELYFPDPIKRTTFGDIYLVSELDVFFTAYIPWAKSKPAGASWSGLTPEERDATHP